MKYKIRKDVITPFDKRLKNKKRIYLSGLTALCVLGKDWAPILPFSPLMILDLNMEPLDEIFGKNFFINCTEYFKKKGFLDSIEEIFCAEPVRAYIEWVYHCLKEDRLPLDLEYFLFTDKEILEIKKYLKKLCIYLKNKGLKRKSKELEKWILKFQESS